MEAARAECWRLFAAYTRRVRPLRLWNSYLASPVQHLEDPGLMMSGEPLCATPLPSWAAALAGGWPRHLERLLRRGGEDPAGPEARLAVNSLLLNGWAAAILRSLPGLAERLRASPPPSIEDLRELLARFEAVQPLIRDGIAAPALLSNAAARAALLNVLAVALRQPLASSAGAQGIVRRAYFIGLAPQRRRGPTPPAHELGQLGSRLVAALRDSCVLEHAARTLVLLLLPLQRVQPGGRDNLMSASVLLRIISRLTWVAFCSAPVDDAVPPTSEPSRDAALRELLSGRCVRHAVLVLGVAALCMADGGPSYGLPGELLRHVPVIGPQEGPDGATVDLRHANGRMVLESVAVENMVHVLRCGARGGPPGRPGALAVMLRAGRLVVASGRAHLGASGGSAAAEAAQRECGGSANSGGGSGGGGRRQEQTTVQPQLLRPPATPGLQLRIGLVHVKRLLNAALEGAMELCFPARPAERPARAAARAECWRLFAAYTRDVMPLPLEGPGGDAASPPPSWMDALAGGWLPCLERLLRRGGGDPAGPEMRLAVSSLAVCLPDVEPCTRALRHLAVLLAYGEPRQAAALVATMGKLLHAADLSALMEPTTADNCMAAAAAHWALEGAIEEWEAASEAAASEASIAALPAPSVAGRQLALMVSCAACEWLPPLARLAMRAMQLRSVPAAAGELQDDAVRTSAKLLLTLLGWLPVLAQRCNMAAFGEAPTDGGVAAAVGDPGSHGGGGSLGPIGGGWPQLLLEEVGAVPLLGAALHMNSGAAANSIAWDLRWPLGLVAAAGPAEAPAIGAVPVPQAQFPWRPQQLRALAAGMRAEGWDAEADGAEALAALLRSWEAGDGEGVGEGELQAGVDAGSRAEAVPRPQKPTGLLAAWRRVEECTALFAAEQRFALALVPVADARGVLRTCSYSG
ncbi:hypothetical protein TSOC_004156 [Tetrabaena socialis]|uniref:Uncharacterized protein n=1 Tax=Tetrabaena socialis TaxID=47790 RepID=A0A2J8A9Q5_9CHLO|nr:hypothetical protein TSOC_004156 [Tetrabaena socialis]|eukprot:PNH09241.1 hypothetical protein TSOC_004156 [Tetrabaena socialis]